MKQLIYVARPRSDTYHVAESDTSDSLCGLPANPPRREKYVSSWKVWQGHSREMGDKPDRICSKCAALAYHERLHGLLQPDPEVTILAIVRDEENDDCLYRLLHKEGVLNRVQIQEPGGNWRDYPWDPSKSYNTAVFIREAERRGMYRLTDPIDTPIMPHSCCGRATRRECNCYMSFDCPVHGVTCIGSHE